MIEYTAELIKKEVEDGYGSIFREYLSGIKIEFKCSDYAAHENIFDVEKIHALCELIKQIVNNKIPVTVLMDYTKPKKKRKKEKG